MKKLLFVLFLVLVIPNRCYAGLVESYFDYGPTSTVTNTNLNGNFDNIRNIINGDIDGDNINTTNGWRLLEILSSPPAAGNQGRVVFLTSNNTLNFDTGSTFVQTPVLSNNQTFSGNNTFTGTTTFSGNVNATATTTISTADINGGTMDLVQIGGTTATGEIIVNDSNDDADGLGNQGTTGQFLISQGTGVNPTFTSSISYLSQTTFTGATLLTGDISITAGKKYMIYFHVSVMSNDNTIYIQFDDDSSDYSWVNDEIVMTTTPASALTGDDADTFISLGDADGATDGFNCTLFLDTNTMPSPLGASSISITGNCVGTEGGGVAMQRTVSGIYSDAGTLTTIEFYQIDTGGADTWTGTVTLYELQ